MAYQTSQYQGDDDHCIDCTGDAVVGDAVRFERATFTGSFRNARFAGFELVTGTIVRDSYGLARQQHTFTLRLEDGSETLIKGRNLYANGLWRKRWADESARSASLADKHARGAVARAQRDLRRELQHDPGF